MPDSCLSTPALERAITEPFVLPALWPGISLGPASRDCRLALPPKRSRAMRHRATAHVPRGRRRLEPGTARASLFRQCSPVEQSAHETRNGGRRSADAPGRGCSACLDNCGPAHAGCPHDRSRRRTPPPPGDSLRNETTLGLKLSLWRTGTWYSDRWFRSV